MVEQCEQAEPNGYISSFMAYTSVPMKTHGPSDGAAGFNFKRIQSAIFFQNGIKNNIGPVSKKYQNSSTARTSTTY
jgi:hypothetical protein